MSEIQLFPQVGKAPWADDELTEAVQSSSAHVQYLLRELSQAPMVAAAELKSKKVAYAIVQRICNSKNKEPLVIATEDETGDRAYSINPDYRAKIIPLVRDAPEPPETPAVAPRPKRARLGFRRGMSAVDGIADPTPKPSSAVRKIAQTSSGRSITFPENTPLEFCQELMNFLNTGASAIRYRIVLDVDGPRLEIN